MKKITGSVFLCFSLLSASQDRWHTVDDPYLETKCLTYQPSYGKERYMIIMEKEEAEKNLTPISFFINGKETNRLQLKPDMKKLLMRCTTNNFPPSEILSIFGK